MKIRSDRGGNVVLELGKRDEQLLAAASAAPFRIKQILVPIDFSDCSAKALQYAVALAQQHAAVVTLLYVVQTVPAYGEYGAIESVAAEAEMRTAGQERLTGIIRDGIKGKIAADGAVRSGSPSHEIVELARNLPADLIVVSTHGHTGLKHVLLGSVTEHVVRNAPCPVLVVREQEHEFIAC